MSSYCCALVVITSRIAYEYDRCTSSCSSSFRIDRCTSSCSSSVCSFCVSAASAATSSFSFLSSARLAILCQVNSFCSRGSHLIVCRNSFHVAFIFSDLFHCVALVLALSSSVSVKCFSPPAITTSFGPSSAFNFLPAIFNCLIRVASVKASNRKTTYQPKALSRVSSSSSPTAACSFHLIANTTPGSSGIIGTAIGLFLSLHVFWVTMATLYS